MERRKYIFMEWQTATYLDHLKRLKSLMSKDNLQHRALAKERRSINNLLARSHEYHRISKHYKDKENKKALQQQQMRFTKYTEELKLPKLRKTNYHSPPSNNLSLTQSCHLNSSISKKLPSCPRAKNQAQLDQIKTRMLENSILHNKITNADSYYQKKMFDRSNSMQKGYKSLIKRKDLSSLQQTVTKHSHDALESLYKESSLMPVNYPQYSYVHLSNMCNRSKYHRIYIKFTQLPSLPADERINYLLQVKWPRKQPTCLVDSAKLGKDLFVFKLPFFKVGLSKDSIQFHLSRVNGVQTNLIGVFKVYPGQNQGIRLRYKDKILEGFICATSWSKIKRKKQAGETQIPWKILNQSILKTLDTFGGTEEQSTGLLNYLNSLTLDGQDDQLIDQGQEQLQDNEEEQDDQIDATSLKDRLSVANRQQIA